MEMKVGLTYACMNLKNLAKILAKKEQKAARSGGLNFNGNIVGFLSWPSFFFIHQFCKFLMWFTLVPVCYT